MTKIRGKRFLRASLALLASGLLGTGCVFLEVRRQHERAGAVCRLAGSVSAVEPAEGPLVVVLIRRPDTQGGASAIVDHFALARDGRFRFVVTEPGTYALAAFHDRNSNLVYDLDEPARPADEATTFQLAAGETREGIEITIQPDGRARVEGPVDIRALQAHSARDQIGISIGQLSVAGDVVDLSDPRFGPESGKLGLWKPLDFIFDVGPGIYFLDSYDPKRTPVLFVHGIGGHPQEFGYLIDQLDRDRFQPWFYFYPSGAVLPRIAEHLSQLVVQLHTQHGFRRLFVVAHSMGGLVSRGFLLHHFDSTGEAYVPLFVSISTPWAGHAAAQKGVDHAPAVVYSWIDVAPGSEYLRRIFYADPETQKIRRRLPDHVGYHLLFGFQRKSHLPGPSSDKVVTVASELRPEAQQEADSVFGFDADHTEILRRPETAELLNAILAKAAR